MYDDEIKSLTKALDYSGEYGPALREAIALMQVFSAPPADTVEQTLRYIRHEWELDPVSEARVCRLMIESAARARAERHIELCCLRKDVEDWKQRAEKAENGERLWKTETVVNRNTYESAMAAVSTKLTAAQAEIEELKNTAPLKRLQTLSTKLTNLRAAVEDARNLLWNVAQPGTVELDVHVILTEAIEESKR